MSDALTWRKSSYTGSSGGNCVEVATSPGRALIRDSKNPDGNRLTVTADEWRAFVAAVKADESGRLP